jgi:hypothetical protein
MADTLGSLIDKLITCDLKMFNNQDIFYSIRHMTYEEFKSNFLTNEENTKKLWDTFKKGMDLNLQRNALIDEIDEKLITLLGIENDGKNLQRKHKTY